MNAPPASGCLCIFARAPELGRVKTRLARTLGDEIALAAHERLVGQCLAALSSLTELQRELWIAGPTDHPGVRRWAHRWQLPVVAQRGADLGARMAGTMGDVLARAPFALIVGTDCPTLDATYVRRAVVALQSHDAVLGPAEDGGYGLIGLRRPLPTLFEDVSWGTATVTEETLARAKAAGLDMALLDRLWDVDTAADWERLLAGH